MQICYLFLNCVLCAFSANLSWINAWIQTVIRINRTPWFVLLLNLLELVVYAYELYSFDYITNVCSKVQRNKIWYTLNTSSYWSNFLSPFRYFCKKYFLHHKKELQEIKLEEHHVRQCNEKNAKKSNKCPFNRHFFLYNQHKVLCMNFTSNNNIFIWGGWPRSMKNYNWNIQRFYMRPQNSY